MWQPIETAPKDGTWFLTWNLDHEFSPIEVGRYNPWTFDKYVETEAGLYRKELEVGYAWDGFNNFHRATHWMPLPEPPDSKARNPSAQVEEK